MGRAADGRPRPAARRGSHRPRRARGGPRPGGRARGRGRAPGGLHLRGDRVHQRRRLGGDHAPTPGRPCSAPRVEHSAVRDASARLAPPRTSRWTARGGSTSMRSRERLQSDSRPRPALVHCQWANHEVGTLQPVHEVVALCREAGVTVHVDAAAACGHVPMDLAELDADLVSISAHKLGGVPGAGALIVRRGSRFEPLLGGRRARARAPRRAGGAPGPPRLRRRGRGTGRRRAGHRSATEAATARRQIALGGGRRAGGRGGRGRRADSRGDDSPTWSASACTASRPSPCSSGWTGRASPSIRARPARPRASSRRRCSRRWASTPATRCGSASGGRPPTTTAPRSPAAFSRVVADLRALRA